MCQITEHFPVAHCSFTFIHRLFLFSLPMNPLRKTTNNNFKSRQWGKKSFLVILNHIPIFINRRSSKIYENKFTQSIPTLTFSKTGHRPDWSLGQVDSGPRALCMEKTNKQTNSNHKPVKDLLKFTPLLKNVPDNKRCHFLFTAKMILQTR